MDKLNDRNSTYGNGVDKRSSPWSSDKFLESQKNCQGSHGGIGLLTFVYMRSRMGRTQQNVTERNIYLNKTLSISVAGRLVVGLQPKVFQGLLQSVTFS